MGTLILRPSSTTSNSYTVSPASSAAHSCVNEVASDGDSTYLTGRSPTDLVGASYSAKFNLSGSISRTLINVTAVKLVAVARITGGNGTVKLSLGTGSSSTALFSSSANSLTTSYATYSANVTPSVIFSSPSKTIVPDSLPALWVSVDGYISKSTQKDPAAYIRVTQVYLEITYTELSYSTILVNKDNNTSSVTPTNTLVASGDPVTVSASPASGYLFKGWYFDSSHTTLASNSNPYTFTPTANTTLYSMSVYQPVISILSQDKQVISDEVSFDRCTATFSSDTALSAWEARATIPSVTPARGVGLLVESGTTLAASTPATIYIDDDELTSGDYTYTISVYGKSIDGCWSDGTIEDS